jgi:hypothetical protein
MGIDDSSSVPSFLRIANMADDVAIANLEAAQAGDDGSLVTEPQPLDPAYVDRAKEYNMTEADLRAIPREVAERVFAGADRARIEAFRREPPQPPVQRQPYQLPYVSQPGPPQPPPSAFAPFELKFEADEADVADAPLTKKFVASNAYYAEQLNRLHRHYETQFQGMNEFKADQVRQQKCAVVDRFVAAQGPEWSGVYGKGETYDMDARSQEFLKRDELWMAADGMMLANPGLGRQEALRRAQYAIHFEKQSAIERARADAERKKALAGATDRPRASGATPPISGIKGRAALLTAGR